MTSESQIVRTLGNLYVQRCADQGHESGVEVDRVVISHGQIHTEQSLRGSQSGSKNIEEKVGCMWNLQVKRGKGSELVAGKESGEKGRGGGFGS